MIQIFLFLLIAAFAQDSEEPDCGSDTFLKDGVCQVIDGGCEPDINGDTFWCDPQESIFMDGGRGVTITILLIVIPILVFIVCVILWRKRKTNTQMR